MYARTHVRPGGACKSSFNTDMRKQGQEGKDQGFGGCGSVTVEREGREEGGRVERREGGSRGGREE